MKYSQKLKTCPVCGKAHGIIARGMFNRHLYCKDCNAELMPNAIWIAIFFTVIACFGYLARTLITGKYSAITIWYKDFRPFDSLIILVLYFSQPLFPLSRRRNIWKEFWDKGL